MMESLSLGGDLSAEVGHDPEVEHLLEFLGVYGKIQEIMSWLIEASAESDPFFVGVKRGILDSLLQQLDLDPSAPDTFVQLESLKANLTDRTLHPKPRVEVPGAEFFRSRIKELIVDQENYGASLATGQARNQRVDLAGVARYGYTDWSNVQSRTGHDIGGYIHGLAEIMADPVAYHAEFAGLGIGAGNRVPDHLAVADDWSIQNGRHRSLAVCSLGEDYILQAGMSQWIPVVVR